MEKLQPSGKGQQQPPSKNRDPALPSPPVEREGVHTMIILHSSGDTANEKIL